MDYELIQRVKKYSKRHRRRKMWKNVLSVLGCIVVFCTTYALILPAITQEKDYFCGKENHVHTEKCYTQQEGTTYKVLACTVESLNLHTHSAACYDAAGNYICGQVDYIVHTHDASCYDAAQNLVCALPERPQHVHGESCYSLQGGHVHSADCYIVQKGALLCQLAENAGHMHSESCYGPGSNVLCAIEENHVHQEGCYAAGELLCATAENHVHTESCYTTSLVCQLPEDETHTHSDTCYSTAQICTVPEGHVHDNVCFAQILICGELEGHAHAGFCYEQVIVCQQEETAAHIHTDECYEQITELICGQEESAGEVVLNCTVPAAEVHVHTDGCFETKTDQPLTCGKAEDATHTHTERCYGIWEMTCTLEEHEHVLTCYADMTADLETPDMWEQSVATVQLTGIWADDVIALAKSQLGYQESDRNYIVLEDGISTRGYTRYGEWCGDPYGDWYASFASFCIHYAKVEGMPLEYDCQDWVNVLKANNMYEAAGYIPAAGDLVFFDQNYDGVAERAGLLVEVTDSRLKTIEGNTANRVAENEYIITEPSISGYGILPEQEIPEPTQTETESVAPAATEEEPVLESVEEETSVEEAEISEEMTDEAESFEEELVTEEETSEETSLEGELEIEEETSEEELVTEEETSEETSLEGELEIEEETSEEELVTEEETFEEISHEDELETEEETSGEELVTEEETSEEELVTEEETSEETGLEGELETEEETFENELETEEETLEEETAGEEIPDEITVAVIYTDSTYETVVEDETTVIGMIGTLPEGAQLRAYPLFFKLDGMLCAYDLSILMPDGTEYELQTEEVLHVVIRNQSFTEMEQEPEVSIFTETGEWRSVEALLTENGLEFEIISMGPIAVTECEAIDETEDMTEEEETSAEETSESEEETLLIFAEPLDPEMLKPVVIYTNGTYDTPLENAVTSISVIGNVPEDAEIRAYPFTLEAQQEVLCAYGLSILLSDGTEYQIPEDEYLGVLIQSPVFAELAEVPMVQLIGKDDELEVTEGILLEEGLGFEITCMNEFMVTYTTVPLTASQVLRESIRNAVIYTDESYTVLAADTSAITISGWMPLNAVVKAFPVEIESELEIQCAYDIAIVLPDGSNYEPAEGREMTVHIQLNTLDTFHSGGDTELRAYYIPDGGEPEEIDTIITGDGVQFNADSF